MNFSWIFMGALLCCCFSCFAVQAKDEYGKSLPILKSMGIGRCMDAAVDGDRLYVIGSRRIYSFDIKDPLNPVQLGSLYGLGSVRQLEVQGGYAYVTAREEGMFIIDISNPAKMVKAAHYDSVELATGLAVSGSIAAVANRQNGVEFLDISNPKNPLFLGFLRLGEAQSVFIKGKFAYAGVWGGREMIVCDISDPRNPKIASQTPLEGFGDGVFVRGNLCYAATGHHGRGMKKYDPADPKYGTGHGMEIIDVSDPKAPKKLSRVELPVFYERYIDMWDVQVVGDVAFVGDTEAGVFAIDVKDPKSPSFIGRVVLPEVTFHGKKVNGHVGGFAVGESCLYIAGASTDLQIVDAKGIAAKVPVTPEFEKPYWASGDAVKTLPSVYRPKGQIHSLFMLGGGKETLVAAGYGGVHKLTLKPALSGRQILDTGNIIFDVALVDGKMYLAEGLAGLSLWECDNNDNLKLLGRYKPRSGGVYQMRVFPGCKFAMLHVTNSVIEFVDISSPEKIRRVKRENSKGGGCLYRLPFAKGLLNGRYAGCSWHASGCHLFDMKSADAPKHVGRFAPAKGTGRSFGFENGFGFVDGKVLAVYRGGYLLENAPGEERLMMEKPVRAKNWRVKMKGKVTIMGDKLFTASRMGGGVWAFDISDLNLPVKLWYRKVYGHPGLAEAYDDMLVVPAGRGGVQVYRIADGKPYYGK